MAVFMLLIGCQQQDGEHQESPSTPSKKETKVQITVGGKVWEIDPNRAYQATGVWVNPNPRSLTDAEQTRLAALQRELKTLKLKTERLSDEASYLKRLDKPKLKVRYSFGMPPHRADGDVIDLGEFPMEMRQFTPLQEE
ncbi:hypothetical protein C6501_00460 [Candidatus Poribacteria bacterium]|nr:MAG: hypothetical protein C6501_00460 [Candidatus Poribacteria bacterium]